jgi:hypothetical protein
MVPKRALGLLALLALGTAVAIFLGESGGGRSTVTTKSIASTTTTISGTRTVTVISGPASSTTTTNPGHPARSAATSLEVLLLGVFLVFGVAAMSSGQITKLDFPGGGGFQLGPNAQAQVSGAIAQHYQEPAAANRAYTEAVKRIHKHAGETTVNDVPQPTLNSVVKEVLEQVPPNGSDKEAR